MTAPIDHNQIERDRWLADQIEQSKQRVAAVHEEAERIIANSRKSIQPRLRQVLAECETQLDYDEEREFGWAVDYEDGRGR